MVFTRTGDEPKAALRCGFFVPAQNSPDPFTEIREPDSAFASSFFEPRTEIADLPRLRFHVNG